ncbi:hypothetical protein GCM10010842_26780 [Deinococcus daejeonensis]|uniref:Uncharacterized protein n=1 Tax=Deinococcus daejeonensis TaxID=1007098 RepID=A0ABQ2J9N9_9DEIO|nr:hypothetical protein GCM10010842_26780 [Deinococcus daejeonensis]
MAVTTVVLQPVLEMGEDGLIESGDGPSGIFGCHNQKASSDGDAFSYFVSYGLRLKGLQNLSTRAERAGEKRVPGVELTDR